MNLRHKKERILFAAASIKLGQQSSITLRQQSPFLFNQGIKQHLDNNKRHQDQRNIESQISKLRLPLRSVHRNDDLNLWSPGPR